MRNWDRPGIQSNMGGQPAFLYLGGDRRNNHRWAVPVADIILNDEDRPHAALLRANNRRKVSVVNFSPFNYSFFQSLFPCF